MVPAGTVAVIQRGGVWVVEAESILQGGDLGPALVQVSVGRTCLLRSCGGETPLSDVSWLCVNDVTDRSYL